MSQVMQINAEYVVKKLRDWSAKSGKSVDQLKQEFESILAKTEGKTNEVKYKKALNALKRTFETSMNSTAISYDIIILGASSPFDGVKKRRADIEARYKKSPSECIASGEVRLEGNGSYVLIDVNKTFPSGAENFNYGKPIPAHSWMTTCYAVAKKPGEDHKWLPAQIVLRDELATGNIPFFTEMSVRLNGTFSGQQGKYLLNSSKGATNFSMTKQRVDTNTLSSLIDEVFGSHFVLPSMLKEQLAATKDDPARFVVTEATLNRHYKNASGVSSIELTDESLDIGEKITGFVDPNIANMLDNVQDGEMVSVMGKTSLSDEKDPTTKQPTGNKVLTMNVYSVFPRPE